MVKMAWERGGARVRWEEEEGVTWGKVAYHLFVDLDANILWRMQGDEPQKADILWRTAAGAPQKVIFLWRISCHASVAHHQRCATEKAQMDPGPMIEGGTHQNSVAHDGPCATEVPLSVAHGG